MRGKMERNGLGDGRETGREKNERQEVINQHRQLNITIICVRQGAARSPASFLLPVCASVSHLWWSEVSFCYQAGNCHGISALRVPPRETKAKREKKRKYQKDLGQVSWRHAKSLQNSMSAVWSQHVYRAHDSRACQESSSCLRVGAWDEYLCPLWLPHASSLPCSALNFWHSGLIQGS